MRCLSRKFRRALRLIGWNLVFIMAALALVVLAGEAWLRSTVPFRKTLPPKVFVPGVGAQLPPDTEIRWTNELDFRTVSRTNRLGFPDREPPSPQRVAESCHIAVIGDSFVGVRQVPILEKLHVRLEERAAQELPHLDVTTSAFGLGGTGQINQLAFYDLYARPLRPKLVVLVFVPNDYIDNFPLWTSFRVTAPRRLGAGGAGACRHCVPASCCCSAPTAADRRRLNRRMIRFTGYHTKPTTMNAPAPIIAASAPSEPKPVAGPKYARAASPQTLNPTTKARMMPTLIIRSPPSHTIPARPSRRFGRAHAGHAGPSRTAGPGHHRLREASTGPG